MEVRIYQPPPQKAEARCHTMLLCAQQSAADRREANRNSWLFWLTEDIQELSGRQAWETAEEEREKKGENRKEES